MLGIRSILCIISLIIISLFVVIAKPEMHKQAMISDAEYGIMTIEAPPSQLGVNDNGGYTPANINVVPQPTETRPLTTGNNNITPVRTTVRNVPAQTAKPAVKQNVPKPASNQSAVKQQPKQTARTQPKGNKTQTSQPQTVPQQKTVAVKPTQNIENKSKPFLTEQEEIIAWNKWHSRIQNQVMMDSNIRAPLGTQFHFTFTIDKYGNMSNVKVWAVPDSYTNYAVRVIKPVIMSYRHQPILNFPEGTRRIVNNFVGRFQMSRTTQYSTPENYHDYEHVRH